MVGLESGEGIKKRRSRERERLKDRGGQGMEKGVRAEVIGKGV